MALATVLTPLMVELIITGLRAGREAMKLVNSSDMTTLPESLKMELLVKRDQLDAEFDRLNPP